MTYREFLSIYQRRKKYFETEFQKELLKKAYIKLRKGSEIRYKDITQHKQSHKRKISNILIDVPQVEMVKSIVDEALSNVEVTQETDIRVVFGDYGHGKSQTANLLVENLRLNPISTHAVYMENITTFREFLYNFGNYSKNYLMNNHKHIFSKVENYIDLLENSVEDLTIGIPKLISTFVKFNKVITKRGLTYILLLDELDKIVRDETELYNWIDFLVTLTDESDLSILIVCFMPQNTANELVNLDRRMERWNNFFTINSVILDGKYSSSVDEGIANIIALSDNYHHINLDENSLEFIFNVIKFKRNYLASASIRAVNTWAISMSELLIKFVKMNLWSKYNDFSNYDKTKQGLIYESKLKQLFKHDHLPQFELTKDDSDDTEVYRVEYFPENIKSGKYYTDGHFKQYVTFMNTETIKHTIALEVKYTTEHFHQGSQIEKVISVADQYPTVFVSLGLKPDEAKELAENIANHYQKDIRKYPIKVINIPSSLLPPLLILPGSSNESGFKQKIRYLITWSLIISGHREELEHFFRELPTEMASRNILLRSHELANIPINLLEDRNESDDIEEAPTIDKAKEGGIFMGATIISMLEKVSSYKYLSTIEKNVKKTINDKYPVYATEIIRDLSIILNELQKQDIIERGGAQNTTIRKKEWDADKAMQVVKSIYH